MSKEQDKGGFFSSAFGWMKIIILALVVAFAIRYFLISPVTVYGDSMDPTLHDGEHLFINKLSTPKRFDIIVFPAPDEEGSEYIKRIIGLPGDTIEYKKDTLYINGKKYEEPYLDAEKKELGGSGYLTKNFKLQDLPAVKSAKVVPKNQLFVLGDNRRISKDSRYIGFIKQEDVIGKVISFGNSLKR
ncbi:putative type-I signal peptidase [Listeria floridensis FSL S10-1187]|uniref:Signal peptidase I n=1 Tax=Listeria floridensis FSL S10-1187 TaxID=1265817 RepID=A0ABN0RCF0_9LIST|nr:type I signal peptidase SipX [Listeria floridensis]EUJ27378.1 putative type-I signal peptidase [Listeria floridensis FSL S10-1187]